jgi:hypothetical protein
MGKVTPAMNAGDHLARAVIPAIKKVARALPQEEQLSFLLGFVAHLFGFFAARYSVRTALELMDAIRPIVERMGTKQERAQTH